MVDFLFLPQALRLVREDSSARVMEGMWNCCSGGADGEAPPQQGHLLP